MAAATHHRPSLVIDARARTRGYDNLFSLPFIRNKVHGKYNGLNSLILSSRRQRLRSIEDTSFVVSCTTNSDGQSDDPERRYADNVMDEIRKEWEKIPQPVKTFPWSKALENFIGLILGLVFAVVKYLSVPILAVTSLSEMSYCAHERKMLIIPIPVLAGAAVAGNWNDTFKEGDYAWHLGVMASFFVLLKLLGPYYPYWFRMLIPHFSNGGLLRIAWLAFLWYRRPKEAFQTTETSASDH